MGNLLKVEKEFREFLNSRGYLRYFIARLEEFGIGSIRDYLRYFNKNSKEDYRYLIDYAVQKGIISGSIIMLNMAEDWASSRRYYR